VIRRSLPPVGSLVEWRRYSAHGRLCLGIVIDHICDEWHGDYHIARVRIQIEDCTYQLAPEELKVLS